LNKSKAADNTTSHAKQFLDKQMCHFFNLVDLIVVLKSEKLEEGFCDRVMGSLMFSPQKSPTLSPMQ